MCLFGSRGKSTVMNTMVVPTVQKGRKPSRVNFNLSSKYGKKELHRKLSCVLSDELVVYSNSIRLFSSKCALEGNDGFTSLFKRR